MKETITVTFTLDSNDYIGAKDDIFGVLDVSKSIIKGLADYPANTIVMIAAGNMSESVKMNEQKYEISKDSL